MVATYNINSPLNRQERTNLNDSLNDAQSRLISLQRQINTLSGGVEIEALLNEIGDTINNANASIGDINTLIDRSNEYLVTFEQAERDVNEAVTSANNATASANRAVQNLDGALQDTIDQANTTINTSLQANTRTVDDLIVRTEAELNGTIASTNEAVQGVVQTAEQLNADLAGYNIPISDFNLSTAYVVNQPVRFNGTTYRAKTATQNNPLPTSSQVENTWWTLEAQRGVDGNGAVSSVAGVLPTLNGDVNITPRDINALGEEHLAETTLRHVEIVNSLPSDYNNRGILFQQTGATQMAPERPTYDVILEQVKENTSSIISKIMDGNGVKWIAHRGATTIAPSNSIPAYELSGKLGYWGCETDAQVTSDGVWVTVHDTTIDAATNGTGAVKSMTYNQLQTYTLDAGNNIEMYPNLKIPTFEEYLKVCKKYNTVPCVEMKAVGLSGADYDSFMEILQRNNMIDKVLVSSFEVVNLTNLRQRSQVVALEYLVNTMTEAEITIAKNIGGCGISPSHTTITKALVESAHRQGVHVNCFTIFNTVTAKTAIANGVDAIITESLRGVI